MSPIDRELEQALAARAGGLTPPGHLFDGVEREARGIRRRRAAVSGAAALSVLAIAVAVPMAVRGGGTEPRPPQIATQPPAPPSPAPAASPGGMPEPTGRPGVLGWVPRGTATPPPGMTMDADMMQGAKRWYSEGHFATESYAPLWRGTLPDGRVAYVFEAIEPARSFAVFVVQAPDGTDLRIVHGFEIQPRRLQISAYVDGPQDFVVIVGAPGTGQLEFSTDGRRYTTVDTDEGTGVVAVTKGEDPKPFRVRAYDGNGVIVYDGPVDLVSED